MPEDVVVVVVSMEAFLPARTFSMKPRPMLSATSCASFNACSTLWATFDFLCRIYASYHAFTRLKWG
jgi:hypothetical protein